MADVIKQEPIRTVYADGSVVISNVRDPRTNEMTSFTVKDTWYDGSAMNDSKVDTFGIFTKLRQTGEFVRRNLPNWGENFLEVDTIADFRALEPYFVKLLEVEYYKGVRLNGYETKNDTPKPIEFYKDSSGEADNGANVVNIGTLKFRHTFSGSANSKYFGLFGDGVTDITDRYDYFLRYCADNNLEAVTDDGVFMVRGTANNNTGIKCPSNIRITNGKKTIFKLIPTRSIYSGIFGIDTVENVKINILNVEGDKYGHLAPNSSTYLYWSIGTSFSLGAYVLNQAVGLRVTQAGTPSSLPELNIATSPVGTIITNGTAKFEVVEDVKESGHGIKILNSKRVIIQEINGVKCFGDAVYIAKNLSLPYDHNKDITINILNANDNRRQGLSVITVDGLYINGGTISSTKGTNPQCGVDIEPNHNTDVLKNIRINTLKTENNQNSGITIFLNALNTALPGFEPSNQEVDIKIKDHSSNGDRFGFAVRGKLTSRIKGLIEYSNAVIVESVLEGIILTEYINQPDLKIIRPLVVNANTGNIASEISPAIRHTYASNRLPETSDYIPAVNIENPLVRSNNNKTRYAVYVGVPGIVTEPVKNSFVKNVNGEGMLTHLVYYVSDIDLMQDDLSTLKRTIPTNPTTFEINQFQFYKEYDNASATGTNFIMLSPQAGRRRIRIYNRSNPTPRILGVTFKNNIGAIVGIVSNSGRIESGQSGAYVELEYIENSANLWRIISGTGDWNIVNGSDVKSFNMNNRPIDATTSVRGLVKQAISPNGILGDVGATYNQAEVQAIVNRLKSLEIAFQSAGSLTLPTP